MKHRITLSLGAVAFRVGSSWPEPIMQLRELYRGYPAPEGPADYTVRLEPDKPLRRWVRPSVAIRGDYVLPDAAPLPLSIGLLAAEMGMNLQMALGEKRYLLLHAGSAERDGRALLLTGESGAGKSTLTALLGERGWRFMGDEFALLEPAEQRLYPHARPVSLKNRAIDVMREAVDDTGRFGPLLEGTPKGTIRHLRPGAEALQRLAEPARPALILFPRFGAELAPAIRPVGRAEVFVRLTQASTNYVALGKQGFEVLTRLVCETPAAAIDYPDAESAIQLVEQLWSAL